MKLAAGDQPRAVVALTDAPFRENVEWKVRPVTMLSMTAFTSFLPSSVFSAIFSIN